MNGAIENDEAMRSGRVISVIGLWMVFLVVGNMNLFASQVLGFLACAWLWVVHAPWERIPRGWGMAFGIALIWPLMSLLPGSGHAAWLGEDAEKGGWQTLSAQPHVTWQWYLVYVGLAGLALWFLLSRWNEREKFFVGLGLTAGFALMAALSISGGVEESWWPWQERIEPHVGRNVQASLLAAGAVVSVAWGLSWRGRVWVLAIGLISGGLCGLALAMLGSRAAAALAALGVGGVVFAWQSIEGGWRRGAVCAAVLLAGALAGAAGIKFAGEAGRFARPSGDDGFRWNIQKDALVMTGERPFTGVGLGNFEEVFALWREKSKADFRAFHPENDWLWLAAECGWPLTLFLGGLVAAYFYGAFRHVMRRRSIVATGGMTAVGVMLVHGMVDAPAHTPVLMVTGLLCGSLAWPGVGEEYVKRAWLRGVAVGMLFLIGVAGVWREWAGGTSTHWVRKEIVESAAFPKRAPGRMYSLEEIERALQTAPMDWNLREAYAHALLRKGKAAEAEKQFRIARKLEPFSVVLAEREAEAWRNSSWPEKSYEAVVETVRRSEGELRVRRYKFHLSSSRRHGELWSALANVENLLPERDLMVAEDLAEQGDYREAVERALTYWNSQNEKAPSIQDPGLAEVMGRGEKVETTEERRAVYERLCEYAREGKLPRQGYLMLARLAASEGLWREAWQHMEIYMQKEKS